MTMDEYQQLALRTAADRTKNNELFHLILGLVGETGEIAEKFKAMPNCKYVLETSVSPVIGVHTGPGLLALSVKCDSGMDNIKEDK